MARRWCVTLAALGTLGLARPSCNGGPCPSVALRGSNSTTVTAAPPPAANCSRHGDVYNCDADETCKWCSWPGAASQCKEVAYTPGRLGSCSDQVTGCPGIRAAQSCTEEQGCQWCKSWTQGWEYCTDIANDERGVATCNAGSSARANGTVAAGRGSSSTTSTTTPLLTASPGINCSRLSMFACGIYVECKWCMTVSAWEFCTAVGADETHTVMCLTGEHSTLEPDVQGSKAPGTTTLSEVPGSNCSSHDAMQSCESDSGCQWCTTTHPDTTRSGHCRRLSEEPGSRESCGSSSGATRADCSSKRSAGSCASEEGCRWCISFTSGREFCTLENEQTCADETTSTVPAEDEYENADEHWDEEEEKEEEVVTTTPNMATSSCEEHDMYSCHDSGLCKFCLKRTTGMGMCRELSYDPQRHESCGPPEVSCAGKRTADKCLADYTCQWCTRFTQGWTYCTDASLNETSADCEVMGSDNIFMF